MAGRVMNGEVVPDLAAHLGAKISVTSKNASPVDSQGQTFEPVEYIIMAPCGSAALEGRAVAPDGASTVVLGHRSHS